MAIIFVPDFDRPIAVRLTRREWKSPLILDFEGLTDRVGSQEAERIWDALYVRGECKDASGTRYVKLVPYVNTPAPKEVV